MKQLALPRRERPAWPKARVAEENLGSIIAYPKIRLGARWGDLSQALKAPWFEGSAKGTGISG